MAEGDEDIVAKIAEHMGKNKESCFATKLCFFNNETAYPIYDSCASAALEYHKDKLQAAHPTCKEADAFEDKWGKAIEKWEQDKAPQLKKSPTYKYKRPPTYKLKSYPAYKALIDYCIDLYALSDLICKDSDKQKIRANYKSLDWYLWVFGKTRFNNPQSETLKEMTLIPKIT